MIRIWFNHWFSTSYNLIELMKEIPRYKSNARHEFIRCDEKILEMANIIMQETKLEYPCNLQFRLKDNVPYLLEINTRMSGGLHMACLAADINIPKIALNKILGKEIDWQLGKSQSIVSYIEKTVIV